mgnify:CR=1 FL=1
MERNIGQEIEGILYKYSESFIRSVCEEYQKSGGSLSSHERKNNLGNGTLTRWLKAFGYHKKNGRVAHTISPVAMAEKEEKSLDNISEAELKRLKAELSQAKFEAEAYRKLLEIAEKEFKIDILKKFDTKQ